MAVSTVTSLAPVISLLVISVLLQGGNATTSTTTPTSTTTTTTWASTSTTQAPHVFLLSAASISISEDAAIGTTLYLASTTANGPEVFSLHGASNETFAIDSDTGLVSVQQQMDCEAQSVHVMPITSVSGDFPPYTATSTLTVNVVDVNDNSPVFNQTVYTATALNFPGNVIIFVQATDADCSPANNAISYDIISPNPAGLVVNKNGYVTLSLGSVTGYFEGVVVASDNGGLQGSAGIAVTVYSDCGSVPTIANGTVTLNGSDTSYGASANLTCDRGFRPRPRRLNCTVHGLWQPLNASCEQIFCPDLEAPWNGTVIIGDTIVDSEATFGCDAGFDLRGNDTLRCRTNGNWSAPSPTCQIKDCGTPRGISYGDVTLDTGNTTFGSSAVYTCYDGYQITGDETSLCLYNGTWEAVTPICTPQDCGAIPRLYYGSVSYTNNVTTFGSDATFSCDPGYELSHTDTLMCNATGDWNGTAPTCDARDCGILRNPTGGAVNYTSGTTFGSDATFGCRTGFELSHIDTLTCNATGDWNGTAPTCDLKDCGALLEPSNGSVLYTNNVTTFGSDATFSCDPGYELSHTDTLTCNATGDWNGTAPTCDLKDCGSLATPSQGSVSYSGGVTTYGAVATFICEPGYTLSTTVALICNETGMWDGTPPSCNIQDCGLLLEPSDGSVSFTNNVTTFGSDATFSCDPGYELSHTDILTCNATGDWNGTAPACDIIDCGYPSPLPSHGTVSFSDFGQTTYGSRAVFRCDPGYMLSHYDVLICNETGSWNGSAPSCDIRDCGGLVAPNDGSVSYTNNATTFGSYATFSCNLGYDLSHNDTLLCYVASQSGDVAWDGPPPFCDIKDCGNLISPSNGSVSYTNTVTTFGSDATFSCDPGYELSHTYTLTCSATGEWNGTEPTCDLKDCGPLATPSQGSVSYSGGFTTYGAAAYFSCELGYTLSHALALICNETGMWDGSPPSCDIQDCGTIDAPDNGFFAYSNNVTTFGATATFGCDPGYTLSHETPIECVSGGGWAGDVPTCVIKDCGQLVDPDQGSVSYTGDVTTYGSVATYACSDGYSLTPAGTRQCMADGAWNGSDPTCTIKDCDQLVDPDQGSVSYTGDVTTYGSVATYACSDGYSLTPAGTRQCMADGAWNGSDPTCTIKDCDQLVDPDQGSVSYTGDVTTYGSVATYACSDGYSLTPAGTRQCMADGAWNGSDPTCTIKDCDQLVDPDQGSVSYTGDVTTYGSVATYACSDGYSLTPAGTRQCMADGAWNGSDPTCTIKDCDQLVDPDQGSVSYTGDVTTYGSVATYACSDGYSLTPAGTRQCMADGAWNGSDPTCTIKDCQILPPPAQGVVGYTNDVTTYLSTAVFSCNTGHGLSHSNSRICTADGAWNGTSPDCIPNACSRLPAPAQGSVSFTNNATLYGSQGRYACSPGYTLSHGRLLACAADGNWNDTAPTCNMKDCGELSAPNDGFIDTSGGTTLGATVRYSCDVGFRLYGDVERTCLVSGAWGGVPATCLLERQPVTPCRASQDDRETTWAEALPNQVRIAECPPGFTGNATRKCNAQGNWEPPLYNCERQKVKEIKEQAAALNPASTAAEVQDVLKNLVDITNETTVANVAASDRLTHAELESVATSFQDVADSLTEAKVDDNIEQDFFETASKMIDTPNRETWKTLGDTGSEGAEKVIKAVDTMTGIVTDKFRASGATSKVITKKNIVVEVVKVENADVDFPDLSAGHEDWQDSTTRAFLPNSAIRGNNVVATGVIFRNMSEITSAEQSSANASAKEINGPVVSITISPPPGRLNPPLRLEFEHTVSGYNQPSCSFWEETGNKWSTSGCSVVSSNATMTVCECDHLTNFAVLMSPFVEADAESTALRIVSIVGIGISIVCLILTLAVHFYLWRYLRSDRTTILMHLCVALLASYVLFLAGVDRTESREFCAVVAVLLQYIYLVVFCVMLAEGIEIGVTLLFVFVKRSRIKLLMTAAWVLPAIIVGISLGVSKAEGYGNENFCWLSVESGLIWAFVGPALAIILFNLVCLCIIIKVMFSTKAMEQKKKINKVKAGVRSLGILIPLMGVTWIIGIFYINEDFYWIQYVFAICNGLQGFFIFLFHCLLNQQIRNARAAQKRRKSSTSMKSTMRTKSDLRNTKEYSSNDMSNTYLGKSNDSEDNRKYNGSSAPTYLHHSLSEEDQGRFTPPLGVANGSNLRLNMNTFSSNL